MRNLEVIVKLTERCNIDCKYCYVFNSSDRSFAERPAVMSPGTASALTAYLLDAARFLNSRYLTVYYQGGEPLLEKKSRFEAMVSELQDATASAGVELCLSVQTNAILVDEEWIEIFSRFGIHVAVSLDGPETINDLHRVDHRGRGTYRRTVNGLRRLMDAFADGRLSTSPTILAVIQPEADATEVFQHFINDLDARAIHYQLPDASRNTIPIATTDKLTKYLHDLFLAWSRVSETGVRIRVFSDAMRRLTTVAVGDPNVAISISSDGQVGPPDDWRNYAIDLFKLGLSVHGTSIREFLSNSQIVNATAEISSLPTDCRNCVWRDACGGGNAINPLHRYDVRHGFARKSVYCEVLQSVFLDCLEHLLRSGVSKRSLCESLAL